MHARCTLSALPLLARPLSGGLCNAERTGIKAPEPACQPAPWGDMVTLPLWFWLEGVSQAPDIFFHPQVLQQSRCGLPCFHPDLLHSSSHCPQHRSHHSLPTRWAEDRVPVPGRAVKVLCSLVPTYTASFTTHPEFLATPNSLPPASQIPSPTERPSSPQNPLRCRVL